MIITAKIVTPRGRYDTMRIPFSEKKRKSIKILLIEFENENVGFL
jgi:hypothetical protein